MQVLESLPVSSEDPETEPCYMCEGSGLSLNDLGDAEVCKTCKGDMVLPVQKEDPIKLDHPEDVIFELIDGRVSDFQIDGTPGIIGPLLFEHSYAGFVDYAIEGMIDKGLPDGIYVIESVTGAYHKGDGWMTDDDMDFYPGPIRPATPEEIVGWLLAEADFWASDPKNVA